MSFEVLTDFNKKRLYKMKKVTGPIYRGEHVSDIKTMVINKKKYESLVEEYQKLSKELKQLNEDYDNLNIILLARKKYLNLLKKSIINKLFKYSEITKIENDVKELEEILETIKIEIDYKIGGILFNEKYKKEYYENFLYFQRRLDNIIENLSEMNVKFLINYYNINISTYSSNENYYDEFEVSKKMLKNWLCEIPPDLFNRPMDICQDCEIYNQVQKKIKNDKIKKIK